MQISRSAFALVLAAGIFGSFVPVSTMAAPTRAPRKRQTSASLIVRSPTKPIAPTAKPVFHPTAKPTVNADAAAGQALAQARAAIVRLIQADPALVPQFLRMGFHDCVGGCDGCIDLKNPDNNGLRNAITVLNPIVKKFATSATGVTRTDLWALATVVAVDVGNHVQVTTPVSFVMPWYGRKNCETANKVCRNAKGQSVPCSAIQGPHRNMPSVDLTTAGIFSFFAREFGFSHRETVAIMGAHNVGKLVRTNSGIDGPGGWVPNNNRFVNQYYGGLVGPNVPPGLSNEAQLVAASPPWRPFFLNNTGITENNTGTVLKVPSRHYWTLTPPGANRATIMTNADISLVRHLDSSNLNPTTGRVSCAFKGGLGGSSAVCPVASSIHFAVEFLDNHVWLKEFKAVLDRMTTNGYQRPSSTCSKKACRLTHAWSFDGR